MELLLDKEHINKVIDQLANQIKSDIPSDADLAVIGIRSRGEIVAQRLNRILEGYFSGDILKGTLDITLYRDDLNEPKEVQPAVRSTEIDFDVTGKTILLVDDVLHTGRSVRAAMDALTDLGRPKLVRLAVLVDRGHHQYPICADYVGIEKEVDETRLVHVNLIETDNQDRVIIE